MVLKVGAQLLLDGLASDFSDTKGLGDSRQDKIRVAELGQGDKIDLTRKLTGEFACHLQGQPRLADAAGTCER